MTSRDPYTTTEGVESAIKDAAQKAAAADPSLTVGRRIQVEYFNRFSASSPARAPEAFARMGSMSSLSDTSGRDHPSA
jgi:hypothetical protein